MKGVERVVSIMFTNSYDWLQLEAESFVVSLVLVIFETAGENVCS